MRQGIYVDHSHEMGHLESRWARQNVSGAAFDSALPQRPLGKRAQPVQARVGGGGLGGGHVEIKFAAPSDETRRAVAKARLPLMAMPLSASLAGK